MQVVFHNYSVLHLIIAGWILLLQVEFYFIILRFIFYLSSWAKRRIYTYRQWDSSGFALRMTVFCRCGDSSGFALRMTAICRLNFIIQVIFYNYSVLHLIIAGWILLLHVDFYIIAVHLLSVILSEAKDLIHIGNEILRALPSEWQRFAGVEILRAPPSEWQSFAGM